MENPESATIATDLQQAPNNSISEAPVNHSLHSDALLAAQTNTEALNSNQALDIDQAPVLQSTKQEALQASGDLALRESVAVGTTQDHTEDGQPAPFSANKASSHPTPPPEPTVSTAENTASLPVNETPMLAPPATTEPETLLNGIAKDEPASEPKSVIKTEEPTSNSLVRQREDDAEDIEPAIKRTKIEESDAPADVVMNDAAVQPSIEPATPVSTIAEPQYPTSPITDVQKSWLLEKMRNLKKTKHAAFFLQPVDIVALKIPNYPNVVKHPMDLSTIETKLKTDQYTSPQDFANDFAQIITNSRLFNGDAHIVTITALNMEATFKKFMSMLPGPQETAIAKPVKRASPAAPRPQPRREARQAAPAASPGQTFALQADGTPQIRRDSTTKRPHRTIKPPQNRELSYAKPRRKEHQLELKFCENVLEQIRGPAYGSLNHVFQAPVDPVALNIPHYRNIIKKPMDLSTMAQKLKSGQYGTAKEFRADFDLMIDNCLQFNGVGNPVYDWGVQFRQAFDNLWKNKEKWERDNKKSSQISSDESEDEDEEEEEDDDDPAAAAQQTIAALTKQLAELQKTVAAANWAKDNKKKSKKEQKKKQKQAARSNHSSKLSKPKKVRPLSYDEKQEISNAVGSMNEAQVGKLTQIITDNCEKYRNMGDDMELEIDDLPNDVQALLLKHVRSIFGNPNRGRSPDDLAAEDDDDFAPSARQAGNKRKKHKPMGKQEQQESIAQLKSRLAEFDRPAGSISPGPYGGQADDTSGDEESEESEEE